MRTSKCELCKQNYPGQFFYDHQHAELVCTNCGCCQRGYISEDRQHNFKDTNPLYTVRGVKNESKAKLYFNMTNRYCTEENEERRRNKTMKDMGDILELSQKVMDKCEFIFSKSKELCKRKPRKQTVAAALIVACRESGVFIDTKATSDLLNIGDLGSHVLEVCKLLKISHKSNLELQIPEFTRALGFPYKYSSQIEKLFKRYRKENGSMATNTILALILWRFYLANSKRSKAPKPLDLSFISTMTGSSLATLKNYINNGKCTIFQKVKKNANN